MTAAEAREQLEAEIWRAIKTGGWTKAVEVALAAADFYAEQYADEVLAHLEAEYAGPARLAVAAAEAFERKNNG